MRRLKLRENFPDIMDQIERQGGQVMAAAEDVKTFDGHVMRLMVIRPGSMPEGAVKKSATIMLAAGYSIEECSDRLGVTVNWLRGAVDIEAVEQERRGLNERICELSDAKVLRDLLEEKVDDTTERVDKIAERRRKLKVGAAAVASGMMSAEEKKRVVDDMTARFAVQQSVDLADPLK